MAVTDLGSPHYPLHPLHGIHQPTEVTPARRPRSIRRTTSIDMTRDDGHLDPVYLSGRGRDLWTVADGSAVSAKWFRYIGHCSCCARRCFRSASRSRS